MKNSLIKCNLLSQELKRKVGTIIDEPSNILFASESRAAVLFDLIYFVLKLYEVLESTVYI